MLESQSGQQSWLRNIGFPLPCPRIAITRLIIALSRSQKGLGGNQPPRTSLSEADFTRRHKSEFCWEVWTETSNHGHLQISNLNSSESLIVQFSDLVFVWGEGGWSGNKFYISVRPAVFLPPPCHPDSCLSLPWNLPFALANFPVRQNDQLHVWKSSQPEKTVFKGWGVFFVLTVSSVRPKSFRSKHGLHLQFCFGGRCPALTPVFPGLHANILKLRRKTVKSVTTGFNVGRHLEHMKVQRDTVL